MSLGAVLFDMDGVLIDSARVADQLLLATAEGHGASLTKHNLDALRGLSGVQFWSEVKERFDLPGEVSEYLDSYDAELEVSSYTRDLLAPGIEVLLTALFSEGIPTALVTSATCWRTDHVLALLETRRTLSAVVCADDVSAPKPDPGPYSVAASRLRVAPEQCLVIEDSLSGVTSARAAGMAVLSYVGFGAHPEATETADGVIEDFRLVTLDSLRARHEQATPRGGRSRCREPDGTPLTESS